MVQDFATIVVGAARTDVLPWEASASSCGSGSGWMRVGGWGWGGGAARCTLRAVVKGHSIVRVVDTPFDLTMWADSLRVDVAPLADGKLLLQANDMDRFMAGAAFRSDRFVADATHQVPDGATQLRIVPAAAGATFVAEALRGATALFRANAPDQPLKLPGITHVRISGATGAYTMTWSIEA